MIGMGLSAQSVEQPCERPESQHPGNYQSQGGEDEPSDPPDDLNPMLFDSRQAVPLIRQPLTKVFPRNSRTFSVKDRTDGTA